ncbi:MAG: riboflavin synthase [Flavobacteriaceae bacterium]|nr:riboflavin synthase [Flavobacteriaceae bacterium]
MFTGIIEEIGVIKALQKDGGNLHISVKSAMAHELKIDQSVAHNGVCLTVVAIQDNVFMVTAIDESLAKTNLKQLQTGSKINLERSLKIGDRLDGHIVQGHIDQTAICTNIKNADGSWIFTFEYDSSLNNITIEKGSITVNGVSLTVVNSSKNSFSVAIIPFTYEHTNFHTLKIEDSVNLEFDVIGKYVRRLMIE